MKNVTLPFSPLHPPPPPPPPLAFKLLGASHQLPSPSKSRQRALAGSSVLAPVGFLSAKLLAQLPVVCFPVLLPETFIASHIELHPFF